MPKITYAPRNFSEKTLAIIVKANAIVSEYAGQGFTLTLRQLYYQFVARDLLANTERNYKRLGSIVNDARLAGLIDWEAIEDRTRGLEALAHWSNPTEIVDACASQFRIDKWAEQEHRIEVWIEKEALAGVFAGVCKRHDVPFLSCRGYTSQSEMWRAASRLAQFSCRAGRRQKCVVLHFGDHDPSGIDMSRDIQDRFGVFGSPITFRRLALNMDQIQTYNPPPNPAKMTDSRFESYSNRFGDESWELDALEPRLLVDLVEKEIEDLKDPAIWNEAIETEKRMRAELGAVSSNWRTAVAAATMGRDEEEE